MKHIVEFCSVKLVNFVFSGTRKINKMAHIYMIGAGNLSTHLSLALQNAGHVISGVYSQTNKSAKILAEKLNCNFTNKIDEIKGYDLAIIAVKDDIISSIANKLDGPLVHTSGSKSIDVLGEKACGVIYPLQTFSKEMRKLDFNEIPICIEASNKKFQRYLMDIAMSISKKAHVISSDQRKYIHLAAVIASNFTNLLYQFCEEICNSQQVPYELLKPLIEETSKKAQQISPKEGQTGPASRKDLSTIQNHLLLLNSDPEKQEIYKLISNSILERS